MIEEKYIEQILDRADIVDVVGEYLFYILLFYHILGIVKSDG